MHVNNTFELFLNYFKILEEQYFAWNVFSPVKELTRITIAKTKNKKSVIFIINNGGNFALCH